LSFDEAEILAALDAVVAALEDPDPTKRAYAYTKDAVFVMSDVAAVHGRAEMLRRLQTGAPLESVTVTPFKIEGSGNLASVYGRFSCLVGRSATSPGSTVAMRLLMVWRKESDGAWRIAHEFLNTEVPGPAADAS
jgi:ketosteroid isomerase-like protein